MTNTWRQQPSGRLQTTYFIKVQLLSATVLIADDFFEYVAPPVISTVPMMMLMGCGA